MELGKGFVLDALSTEQAKIWLQLRDAVRTPVEKLDDHDLILEQLLAWLAVLRTLPNKWDNHFKHIRQQVDRWQMRPVTSARAR